MAELKPCPFCGGEAKYDSSLNVTPLQDENGAYVDYDEIYYWERTYCTECGAGISSESDDEEEEITITKWNKRLTMAEHGHWYNTDETVWDAKEIDGKQQIEISIVSARCSVCGHWSEQVNQFPPYMHYKFCPHCGAVMDAKPPKSKKPEPHEKE